MIVGVPSNIANELVTSIGMLFANGSTATSPAVFRNRNLNLTLPLLLNSLGIDIFVRLDTGLRPAATSAGTSYGEPVISYVAICENSLLADPDSA